MGHADPTFLPLTVRNDEVLPPFCLFCGAPAERKSKVRREEQIGCLQVLGFFLLPAWLLLFSGRTKLRVVAPLCEGCAWDRKVKPVAVDFRAKTITLLAHREFHRRLESFGEEERAR